MVRKFFYYILLHQFLFISIYILKRNFFPGKYVYLEFLKFYLFFSFIFAIIYLLQIFLTKKGYLFSILTSYLICFLFNYSIIMTFVVNGDRSPSMYILTLIKNNNGITFNDTKNSMNQIFFDKKKQFKKRIDEQIHLNNIVDKNGKFFITQKGDRVIKIFKIFNYFTNIENF